MLIGITYDCYEDFIATGFEEKSAKAIVEKNDKIIGKVESAFLTLGHKVERIGNIKSLVNALAQSKAYDLVFNLSYGVSGVSRESQVTSLLEAYKIPYIFSSAETLMYCTNKATTKLIARSKGVRTTDWVVFTKDDIDYTHTLKYPLFAKPIVGGDSLFVTEQCIVHTDSELKVVCKQILEASGEPVIVEEYLPGREFSVSIIGTGNDARVLGIRENGRISDAINKKCERVSTHVDKWLGDDMVPTFFIPPEDESTTQAKEVALTAYRALNCYDAGRFDIRCDANDIPYMIELNPITTFSSLGYDAGVSCQEMAKLVLEETLKRIGKKR